MRAAWTIALVLALSCAGACSAACTKKSATGAAGEGGAPTEAPSASSERTPPPTPESTGVAPWPSSTYPLPVDLPNVPPAPSGEALRATIRSLETDPQLRPYLAPLKGHFGDGGLAGPFVEQWVDRAGGGAAVLVSRADQSEPMVLAVDRGNVVFVREHPTGGISPPALHLTLAPGPQRGIALFTYVPAQQLVAARMTAEDGNPFAEIVAMTAVDACDALDVGYAAGWGWIVVCSTRTGARAQRLREDLTGAWGTEGAVVGYVGPTLLSVVGFEEGPVWTLTQKVRAVGGDRTLFFRYDRDAQAVAQPMPSSSTSKTSVEFGGMTGGKPRAP